MKNSLVVLGALSLAFIVPACSSEGDDVDGDGQGPGGGSDSTAECKVDSDWGCAGVSQEEVREVINGPAVRSTNAEVWRVQNQWSAVTTEAGVAWAANSGLTWEQKYEAWMNSFEWTQGVIYRTVSFKTPQGRTIDSAVLECADQGIFFRYVFSAWYKLPFYLTGWVNGGNAYFGHFGVIDRNGNPLSNFPTYKTRYQDHEATWREGQPWPRDTALRGRNAGYDDPHRGILINGNPLPDDARFGTYLDELFLNKRAAHLLPILVAYFGSANLADGANMYHTTVPRAGQVLVKRWQKNGIGHAMVTVHVEDNGDGTYKAEGIEGSMPARQGSQLPYQRYHSMFSDPTAGGPGQTYDNPPVAYTRLGGGLKAWRTPVQANGRWTNQVPQYDRVNYVEDNDDAGLITRWNNWENVLSAGDPEQAYQIAKDNVGAARARLTERPASCSTRTARENAFTQLLRAGERLGKTEAEIRAENFHEDDYIFGELIYNQSKTCCWLTPREEQYEVIKSYYAKEMAEAEANGQCRAPTVFRATEGNYDLWKNHAAEIGKSWPANWTQDESPCPAANSNGTDPLTDNGQNADYCADVPADGDDGDDFEP